MIQAASFYAISAILVASALVVVTQRNIFTCALYLALFLSMIAGFFVLLGADFLAAVQILLYVGGILVILAFAVMLSSVQQAKGQPQVNAQWIPSLLACAGLLALILFALKRSPWAAAPAAALAPTTASLGRLLLGDLSLPFEAVSLVLMASLVGAIFFSKKEEKS